MKTLKIATVILVAAVLNLTMAPEALAKGHGKGKGHGHKGHKAAVSMTTPAPAC